MLFMQSLQTADDCMILESFAAEISSKPDNHPPAEQRQRSHFPSAGRLLCGSRPWTGDFDAGCSTAPDSRLNAPQPGCSFSCSSQSPEQ